MAKQNVGHFLASVNQPKQQRSQETILKLIQATYRCVDKFGYSQVSTSKIAKEAGVSQGGLFKHFPSKVSLMAATVEHIEELSRAEAIKKYNDFDSDADLLTKISYFVDAVWAFHQTPESRSIIEIISEARTDAELASFIKPIVVSDMKAGDLRVVVPQLPNDLHMQFLSQLAYLTIERLSFDAALAGEEQIIEFRLCELKALLFRELSILLENDR